MCIRCQPGEYGEIVGKVIKGNPVKEFLGYLSKNDTDKKLIRDVFTKGDVAFSSGDILYMDERGYLYFKDRTGDTFRWKGENVSTTEVEGIIHNILGLNDAIVYGVEIPGVEGKAGMAVLKITGKEFDFKKFNEKLRQVLPNYARPVFLRVCEQIEVTGTYKLKKEDLQKRGFIIDKGTEGKLYFLNNASGEYEKLTLDTYNKIMHGSIKL